MSTNIYQITKWLSNIRTEFPTEAEGLETLLRDVGSDDQLISFLREDSVLKGQLLKHLEISQPILDRAVKALAQEIELKAKEIELRLKEQAAEDKRNERQHSDIIKPLAAALIGLLTGLSAILIDNLK